MTRPSFRSLALSLVMVAATAARAEPDSFFLGNGLDGTFTVSAGQTRVINGYATVTGPLGPGDNTVSITMRSGSLPITAGDLVMILQTTGLVPVPTSSNGATPIPLNSDPVGRFELARVQSVSGTSPNLTLTLTARLYQSFAASVTQVIKVPEYSSMTVQLNGTLAPSPWNGSNGGVLAFLVSGTLTLDGELQARGDGFRGGQVSANYDDYGCNAALFDLSNTQGGSGKGEGIATGQWPSAAGRGALANGGGGGICHNAGGGGGGNAGGGGIGGEASDGTVKGGYGGATLTFNAYSRLLLGGGGGAGQQNDTGATPGGDGGGIIFVRARTLTGTGAGDIEAPGADAADAVSDGAGGGGAGGTIHFRVVDPPICDDFDVTGGSGGNVDLTDHGPGGGGGGGALVLQGPSWTACNTHYIGGGGNGDDLELGGPEGAVSGVNGTVNLDLSAFALPGAPTLANPAANAQTNDNTPLVSGTSPQPGAQVLLFLDGVYAFTIPSDPVTGAFSVSLPQLSNGAHSVYVHAEHKAVHSVASVTRSFTVDTLTPGTRIENTPPSISNAASDSFSFSKVESPSHTNVSFECSVDSGAFAACTSPRTVTLSEGSHTFRVRALDGAGNIDQTPASYSWTIDRTPPDTNTSNGPPALTNAQTWTFNFTSTETNSTFLCRFDGTATFTACPATWTTPSLSDGAHHLEVQARDAAGNVDGTPLQVDWIVDATPPATTLQTAPGAVSPEATFVFQFTADEASSFECELDGAGFSPCASPLEVTVGEGSHTFAVRATDAAGNVDASAETAAWLVDFPDPDRDPDGDGLDDDLEALLGTDPLKADSDADGVGDGVEVQVGGSNPLDDDSDDDGIIDGFEDADGDGVQDANETGVKVADSDGDGLTDGQEQGLSAPAGTGTDRAVFVADAHPASRTDPLNPDSDGDGLLDGVEDANRDGARGADETDPGNADTDGDTLPDGLERAGANPTNPVSADSDQDGLSDGVEDANRNGALDPGETDPTVTDSDGGGVGDGVEVRGGTDPLVPTDDYVLRGGCSSTSGSPLLWGVLMLMALLVRRPKLAARALALGAAVMVTLPAAAQTPPSTSIDVQQLKPAAGAGGLLGLHGAGVDPHLGWRVGTFVSYGDRPLALFVPATGELVGGVVAGQATLDVLAAISLLNRVELGVALPVNYQLSSGQPLPGQTAALAPMGLGDLRITPKVKVLSLGMFQLGVAGEVTLPTAGSAPFLGSGGFVARPRLAVELTPTDSLRILVNAGANLRPEQRLLNLAVGHEIAGGVGAEASLPLANLRAALTVTGAYGLAGGSPETLPLEVLGALRLPVGSQLLVTLGGGAGMGSGYGTPRYRVLAAVSWEQQHKPRVQLAMPPPPPAAAPRSTNNGDADQDGIPDAQDDCVERPETKNDWQDSDGCPDSNPNGEPGVAPKPTVKDRDKDSVSDDLDLCPELPGEPEEDGCPPDDDNDGIVNPLDQCPTRKETLNGYKDDDGCPDSVPRRRRR